MRIGGRTSAFFGLLILVLAAVQATELLFDIGACGKSKRCHQLPKDCSTVEKCNSLIAYGPADEEKIEFEIWAPSTTNDGEDVNYLAVGFSKDRRMGDDAVTYCYYLKDGEQGIGMGKTKGKFFEPTDDVTAIEDTVKLEEIRVEDGQFWCKFTQKLNENSIGDLLKPNLTDSYHIFFVRGIATAKNKLSIHHFGESGPVITEKIELVKPSGDSSLGSNEIAQSGEVESTSATNSSLLKRLHGAIMLIAWLAIIFNAIYSARYFREHWPSTTVGGLQIWFHIHRTLNILGVSLIVLSVILIFVATDFTWTGPSASQSTSENTMATPIHSLLGVISVIFALGQPFIALLRCAKDHPRRPIFNIVHRSLGHLAAFLAMVTIGIAILLNNFAFYWKHLTTVRFIYIAFLVVSAIILLIQELFRARDRRQKNRITTIEMNNRGNSPSDSYYYQNGLVHSDRYRHITSVLYLLYAGLSISVAVVLAYIALSSSY